MAAWKNLSLKSLPAILLFAMLSSLPAFAEQAWVKDYHRLNLRSGPGTEFRIKGSLETGNEVTLLERGDRWNRVRVADVGEGWIPQGYLQTVAPARVRLKEIESLGDSLRAELETLSSKTSALETENRELRERDATQRSTLSELSRENVVLRAGARWPHWITGASILAIGLLGGGVIHSVNGRRSRPRIRL